MSALPSERVRHRAPNVSSTSKTPIRLALRKEEAAASLGVSDETFDRHIRPSLPVVRCGSLRLYPTRAIDQWLEQHQTTPLEDVA